MVSGISSLTGLKGFDLCLFVRDRRLSQWRTGGNFSASAMARGWHWGLSVKPHGAGYRKSSDTGAEASG